MAEELIGLCMSCRDDKKKPIMRKMTSVRIEKNAKGRYQARGTCEKCGGNMFKFVSEEDAKKFE